MEQKATKTSQEKEGERRCRYGKCRDKLGKNRKERRKHIEKHRKEYETRNIGVIGLEPLPPEKMLKVGDIMKSATFQKLPTQQQNIVKALIKLGACEKKNRISRNQLIDEAKPSSETEMKKAIRALKDNGLVGSMVKIGDARYPYFFLTMKEEK